MKRKQYLEFKSIDYGEDRSGRFWKLRTIVLALLNMIRHKQFVVISSDINMETIDEETEGIPVKIIFAGWSRRGWALLTKEVVDAELAMQDTVESAKAILKN